jgi:hypothetical protein
MSATLQYKVKFSENYSWTAGGKLPGLCPERAYRVLFTIMKHFGLDPRTSVLSFGAGNFMLQSTLRSQFILSLQTKVQV